MTVNKRNLFSCCLEARSPASHCQPGSAGSQALRLSQLLVAPVFLWLVAASLQSLPVSGSSSTRVSGQWI
jgi:hypothetical protein